MKLNPENVSLDVLRQLWSGAEASLDDRAMQRVTESAAAVERIVASGETVYGVNTGFGLLANTRIPDDRLAELQTNLILSHSAGLGDPLPRHVTRLMIVLKLIGLGRGHSGVRRDVIDALAALLDAAPPALVLSLHSFTPSLRSAPEEARPWQVGVLYNEDDRAARLAIPLLEAEGLIVGDQQPYSGKLLNATMNRHAEAHGRPYFGIEIRQDLIGDEAGQAEWAERLARVANRVALDLP
jgi:hypothetical protein